ncbi:hypothetical protein [Humidisolicoccus flavus]|uniref:hypothetical protein n=1 Tax=Humidisolicoccus flavus TaxID=3111414 RepID=UPI00324C15D6
MTESQVNDTRSRWGRVKFGERRVSAMAAALPIGAVLAVIVGFIAVASGTAGPHPLLGGTVFALVTVWPLAGLAWALMVDRSTLQGATDRPEESVENAWYENAASSAFTDTITIVGLSLAVLAIGGIALDARIALAGVIGVAALSFAVRFLIKRARG